MRHEGTSLSNIQVGVVFKKLSTLIQCVFLMVDAPADQPEACSVIPPHQEPGAQAPATNPHHDASQCPAPTHSDPTSGTGDGPIHFTMAYCDLLFELHIRIIRIIFCPQPPQLGLKTNPPPIQEKPQKTSKKPPPAKEELLKMTVSKSVELIFFKHWWQHSGNERINACLVTNTCS